MVAALSEDAKTLYLSSELAAIHTIDKTSDYWQPNPGSPVIATLDGEVMRGTGDVLEGMKLK
jgi:hypothetical protein